MSKYSNEQIETIAAACHEGNRAYCQEIGDDSQLPWEEAEEWQRQSARDGVVHAIENPTATPLNMHQNWMADKAADGWVYGTEKDAEKKTHPCMVPYDELPETQRRKDEIFIITVRNFEYQFENPGAVTNEKGGAAIDEQMTDVDEPGYDGDFPSLRVMCGMLRDRVEDIMAKTGKRPGDLVAFSATLAEIQGLDIPLMDWTEPAEVPARPAK